MFKRIRRALLMSRRCICCRQYEASQAGLCVYCYLDARLHAASTGAGDEPSPGITWPPVSNIPRPATDVRVPDEPLTSIHQLGASRALLAPSRPSLRGYISWIRRLTILPTHFEPATRVSMGIAMHRYSNQPFSKYAVTQRRLRWAAIGSLLLALSVLSVYVLQSLGLLR